MKNQSYLNFLQKLLRALYHHMNVINKYDYDFDQFYLQFEILMTFL